jgi:phosphoserine phosphatase RsbU/P
MLSQVSTMDTIRAAVALLVTTSGVLSLLLFAGRIRRRENSLLYFGLCAIMYGVRLSLQATHHIGGTADLLLSLLIPIPLVLFLVETVAREWKKMVWWFIGVELASALFALGTRLLHFDQALARSLNSVVVLLAMPLFVSMAFFPRRSPNRDLQVFRTGLILFLLFAVYTNLVNLGLIVGSGNLEFIGFTINLCCLGYVALARTQRNEERLLSLNKELEIARTIQAQLLPQSISGIGGLTIGARYVPATSVAGDFYDFLIQEDSLGVLIADVSGHGIPAALSASMVKVAVRAQMERAGDPAAVLRGINSILCGNLQGQFVTAAYMFVDPANGHLAYAGAGHPPLLVWRSCTQRVENLQENGLLLGIFPGNNYTAKSAPLARGDRCLLYTDGLLEATCPSGEEFGSERLEGFLAEHASLAPQPFCDALVQHLTQWCGKARHAHDDVTIVAIDFS